MKTYNTSETPQSSVAAHYASLFFNAFTNINHYYHKQTEFSIKLAEHFFHPLFKVSSSSTGNNGKPVVVKKFNELEEAIKQVE